MSVPQGQRSGASSPWWPKKKWWLLRRTFQINCQESIRHFMEAEVFGYFVQRLYASQCNKHSRKCMDADSLHFRVLHRATSLVAKRFTDHTRSELKKFLRIFHDYNDFLKHLTSQNISCSPAMNVSLTGRTVGQTGSPYCKNFAKLGQTFICICVVKKSIWSL